MTLIADLEKKLEKTTTLNKVPVVSKDLPISEGIQKFKSEVIKYANEALSKSKYLEVKEVKDLTTIITMIENSSNNKADANPTINILVQNILDRQKDDC